mmetsp:Transcript_23160/g.60549  ORF Transcript_23160/g.60549 Transcript_23160/m.60549 type:complete len:202 (-) Transcript_23160:109-714(-)
MMMMVRRKPLQSRVPSFPAGLEMTVAGGGAAATVASSSLKKSASPRAFSTSTGMGISSSATGAAAAGFGRRRRAVLDLAEVRDSRDTDCGAGVDSTAASSAAASAVASFLRRKIREVAVTGRASSPADFIRAAKSRSLSSVIHSGTSICIPLAAPLRLPAVRTGVPFLCLVEAFLLLPTVPPSSSTLVLYSATSSSVRRLL